MDLAEVLSRHGPAHPQGCGGGATTGLNFANRVAARHPFLQILLYRGKKAPHGAVLVKLQPYGQPEEETPAQDEQAQAPQALEVAPPPEAHLAEISATPFVITGAKHLARRRRAAGFRFQTQPCRVGAVGFKKR